MATFEVVTQSTILTKYKVEADSLIEARQKVNDIIGKGGVEISEATVSEPMILAVAEVLR